MLSKGLHKYISHDCQRRMEMLAELIVEECNQYALRNWEHGHLLGQDLKIYFGFEIENHGVVNYAQRNHWRELQDLYT